MLFSEFYPDYLTATILEWKHLLKEVKYKDIKISSLQFLVQENRLKVYAFCIMSNHIHVIWQVQANHQPKDVQLSFMKFTAQMIIKDLRNSDKEVLEQFNVKAIDRTHQIWERNALSTSLRNQGVFKQKLNYLHNNPGLQVCTVFLKSINILPLQVNGFFNALPGENKNYLSGSIF